MLSNIYMVVELFSYFSTINFDNRHGGKWYAWKHSLVLLTQSTSTNLFHQSISFFLPASFFPDFSVRAWISVTPAPFHWSDELRPLLLIRANAMKETTRTETRPRGVVIENKVIEFYWKWRRIFDPTAHSQNSSNRSFLLPDESS